MNFRELIDAVKIPMGEESLIDAIEHKNIEEIRKRMLVLMGLSIAMGMAIGVLIFGLSSHGVI